MRRSLKAVLVLAAFAPLSVAAQQQPEPAQRGIVRIGGGSGLTSDDRANYCL